MKKNIFIPHSFKHWNIALLFIISGIGFSAKADSEFWKEGLRYNILSEEEAIVEVIRASTANSGPVVVVPETVSYNDKSYKVVALADKSFYSSLKITKIELPESVTRIGKEAFSNCNKLESVSLSNSITEISEFTFYNCRKLREIQLPSSLQIIGDHAFENCISLPEIIIPDKTTSVGEYAFAGCSNMKIISISKGVMSLGENFIKNCTHLREIIVSEENTVYSSYDGILYNNDFTRMLLVPLAIEYVELPSTIETIPFDSFAYSQLKSINIPNTVKEIYSNAFMNCKNLTFLDIPNSIDFIGSGAFYGCSNLESIKLSESIKRINEDAFSGCPLRYIVIPNSVTSIGDNSFKDCVNLENIEFPANLNYIGRGAFQNTGFMEVSLPESVKTVGSCAFAFCTSLEKIYIPDSTEILAATFMGCQNLIDIQLNSSNPNYYWEDGILYNHKKTEILACPRANGEVYLPDGIKVIGDYSFSYCYNLTFISIPASVRIIGSSAFQEDINLKTMLCYPPTPPAQHLFAFSDENGNFLGFDIYVPDESYNLYKQNRNWFMSTLYPMSELAGINDALVSPQNELVTVYTIDGKILFQNQDRGCLDSLPSGFYIINGKKVMIK